MGPVVLISLVQADKARPQAFGLVAEWLLSQPVKIQSLLTVGGDGKETEWPQSSSDDFLANVSAQGPDTSFETAFSMEGPSGNIGGTIVCRSLYGPKDPHEPVRISFPGEAFTRPPEQSRKGPIAAMVTRLFGAVCRATDPSYAAITVEYDLEGPQMLRSEGKSYGFEDCYLSRRLVSAKQIEALARDFPFVVRQDIENGTFFYGGPIFSPETPVPNVPRRQVEAFSVSVAEAVLKHL